MANERGFALLARATRLKVLPVMLGPVAVGAALAWSRTRFFSWGWFAVTATGAAAMHLGSNVINDYFDEASGAEDEARRDTQSLATGSGVVATGLVSKRGMLGLAGSLFTIALGCAVALAIGRGPAVLWLGAIGFVLAVAYVAPPVAYGYLGRGLGEAGIFLSFGLLPVAGSYYVQALRIDAAALWGAVVPGLLTTLILYHHHFLHWRSDRASKKMTPVAALGPERGLVVSRIAIAVLVVTLALQSLVFHLWPPGVVAAAVFALPILAAIEKAREEPGLQAYVRLLGSSLGASVLTSAWLVGSLIVRSAPR